MVYFLGSTTALLAIMLYFEHAKCIAQVARIKCSQGRLDECYVKVGQQDVEIEELKFSLAQTKAAEMQAAVNYN